jgi:hypothetical protein
MENPPGIEKKKECLVVEQQGKGFTLVDENKDNYLWQDEHGQVLWTKDRNVLDAAKKEIEAKLNTPTPEEKAKNMAPEDAKKIEDDLAQSEQEDKDDEKIATEKKLEKEKMLGITPTTTSPSSTPLSTPAPGSTAPTSDEEKERKLRELQKGIIADRKREKERKAQGFLDEARTEQNQKIEDTRKEYIDAYGQSVKNVNGLKKFGYKIGNFLGINRKDAFTDGYKKDNYEYEKNWKGDETLDKFVDKRIQDRLEKYKKEGKTDEEIQDLIWRYKGMIQDKNEAFSNKDFDFVRSENKLLREKKETTWEKAVEDKKIQKKARREEILEKGTVPEKMKVRAEEMAAKAGKWISQNKAIRYAIGNKWIRFGLITGGVGLATGGMSTFFLANRVARFAGGMLGGALGKTIGELTLDEEKMDQMLSKRVQGLNTKYQRGYISASEYDKERESIDLAMTRYARLKQGLVIGLAGGVGAFVGSVESALAGDHTHDIPTKTPEHRDQTTPVNGPEKTTPVNQTPGTPPQPAPIQESPTPTETQTPPPAPTETAPTETTTPTPKTPVTTAPDEYSIVKAGSGKGIEHAFRAQIEHDQALAEKLKDLYHYKGAIGTAEELHKFSGVVAHQMALGEGYIGADGAERWVSGTASYDIDIEPNGEVVIHERALDAQGNWTDTENSQGTFETGADKNASGAVYEQTHKGGDAHHVENIRKSINQSFSTKPEINVNAPIEKPGPIELPPPTNLNKPINLPPPTNLNKPINLPPPTHTPQYPTVPVQPIQSSPVAPQIYNPSMMNPGPRNPLSSIQQSSIGLGGAAILGGAMVGSKMNRAPSSGKSFLDILLEGFFGPEKPSTPSPFETTQNGGEGIA